MAPAGSVSPHRWSTGNDGTGSGLRPGVVTYFLVEEIQALRRVTFALRVRQCPRSVARSELDQHRA
eukprot:1239685-Prymnesium_polylepis.1